MSKMLRIALVAEGVTDYYVINAAISSMLTDKSYDLKMMQPEESVAFTGGGDAGPLGGGWKGVYKWCLQSAERGSGKLSDDPLFIGYDVLLIHIDADVAAEDPSNDEINPLPSLAGLLPCEQPCPHPRATTDSLREVILKWAGEISVPPRTVLCTPSKSTEAWIVALFFPDDKEMIRKGWECHPKPESRLAQQPKDRRFQKNQAAYKARHDHIRDNWSAIVSVLLEANRFQEEFLAAIDGLVSK